jgi:hypothetical protein
LNRTVTIPREEYDRLIAAAEALEDLAASDRVAADLAAGVKSSCRRSLPIA